MKKYKVARSFIVLALFLAFLPADLKAYSLLTHEAIIDVSWKKSIEPLLLKKYPGASSEQLLEAHSYAYGGAIMPDIGYSPFGSMIYTDFVHNVRSGDYVEALLEEAEDINEYAFALGSLAHYMADNYGHSTGTNMAVSLAYPNIGAKFGNIVTYADDHLSHSRLEFAFDVLQTARGNYASKAYHDFIGFNVATPVVEKAFYRTYGVDVNSVFKNLQVAISTFRWTIKALLPTIVRTAWVHKKSEIRQLNPGATVRDYSYRMKKRTYYHEFGKDHQKAGILPSVLAVLVPVLPKIGPLAKLRFKTPSPEVEKIFIASFDTSLEHYESALTGLRDSIRLAIPNKTLDTGHKTRWGEYSIADENYTEFLLMMKAINFENVNPEIKANLIAFFKDSKAPKNKRDLKRWIEIRDGLNLLDQQLIAERG